MVRNSIPRVFQDRRPPGSALVQDLDFLVREPAQVYHAKADQFLSSHQLADFRSNPLLFHKKRCGLVQEEDRPVYILGRAAHTLILEGRKVYEGTFAIGGPINPKTGAPFGSRTKKFLEWAKAQGKPVLTSENAALIEEMERAVRAHKHAAALLGKGVPEGVVRAHYNGIPCQARLDWLHPERGLTDLKTCDNLDWFPVDARSYGYVHQVAFYRSLLEVVTGVRFPVHIIAVEKREPFRCGVWRLGQEVLALAAKENEAAMEGLKGCLETDTWPTGYEEIRVLDHL